MDRRAFSYWSPFRFLFSSFRLLHLLSLFLFFCCPNSLNCIFILSSIKYTIVPMYPPFSFPPFPYPRHPFPLQRPSIQYSHSNAPQSQSNSPLLLRAKLLITFIPMLVQTCCRSMPSIFHFSFSVFFIPHVILLVRSSHVIHDSSSPQLPYFIYSFSECNPIPASVIVSVKLSKGHWISPTCGV